MRSWRPASGKPGTFGLFGVEGVFWDVKATRKDGFRCTFEQKRPKSDQKPVNGPSRTQVTPGYTKFLLLHDGKNEEAVRHFFLDVVRRRPFGGVFRDVAWTVKR